MRCGRRNGIWVDKVGQGNNLLIVSMALMSIPDFYPYFLAYRTT